MSETERTSGEIEDALALARKYVNEKGGFRDEDGVWWDGSPTDRARIAAALLSLQAENEQLRRERDDFEFQLKGLEHVRRKDNDYLIQRAEAAEAELTRLREVAQEVVAGWGQPQEGNVANGFSVVRRSALASLLLLLRRTTDRRSR